MSGLKSKLKDARERRNLTVQQVAALTNIKTEHIRALEEGNYAFFSAPIYIRGFVRSIAIALKLDLTDVMSELDIELEEQRENLKNADLQQSTESLPQPQPQNPTAISFRGLPWKWITVTFFVLVICVIGFFVSRYFTNKPTDNQYDNGEKATPGIIKRNYHEALELPLTNSIQRPQNLE